MPIFTNEYVTLLHVMVPPGHTSGYHEHSADTASVVVESANVRAQILGETPVERPAPFGVVSYTAYSKKPLTHVITNIDTHPVQVVLVELMYPETGDLPHPIALILKTTRWRSMTAFVAGG